MSQEEPKRKRGRPRKYATPEEARAAQQEQIRQWHRNHPRKQTQKVYHLIYTFKNPDEVAVYQGMIQALTSRKLLPLALDSVVKSEILEE